MDLHKLNKLLEHSGVKGMHWGVRNDNHRLGTHVKSEKKRSAIGQHLDSMKRERQWHSVLKDVHMMTTKDINTVTKRIRLENSLKDLSKAKIATKKDKQDYLNRHKMSDQELVRKVNRLQAKKSLHEAISNASKAQRELGIKIAQVGGSIGVKYVTNGRKIHPKDVIDAIHNPSIKTKQDVINTGLTLASGKAKNKKVKDALDLAKTVRVNKPKS